jgi:opacity protein-like surface antigen
MLAGGLGVVCASGQAVPTAGQRYTVSVFGAASDINPDYGPRNNTGYVFGGDVTRHFRLLAPSIEARYGHSSGDVVAENYFLGNVKVEKALGPGLRLHPYGEAGIGYGVIHFGSRAYYPEDNSVIYAVGGGADVDVSSRIALKGEYSYQSWKLGTETSGLTPHGFSAGLVYRFAFGLSRR